MLPMAGRKVLRATIVLDLNDDGQKERVASYGAARDGGEGGDVFGRSVGVTWTQFAVKAVGGAASRCGL